MIDRYAPALARAPRYTDTTSTPSQPILLATDSGPMRHVFDRPVSIARSDATPLITGESGTEQGGHCPIHPPAQLTRTFPLCQRQLRGAS